MIDQNFEKSIITSFLSPNFNKRPKPITHIVLHYTDLPSIEESLQILCDHNSKVSSHFLIDDNADIYKLVHVEKRAWHAGVSTWEGVDNVNDYSIGIELQNTGHSQLPLKPYPAIQMHALITLLEYLTYKYKISRQNVIGHSDIAPDRKKDPGEHFNWDLLKEKGFRINH